MGYASIRQRHLFDMAWGDSTNAAFSLVWGDSLATANSLIWGDSSTAFVILGR